MLAQEPSSSYCFRLLCRRADQGPLLALGGHARWVWRVRHNPVHDALMLTSAGDSLLFDVATGPSRHQSSVLRPLHPALIIEQAVAVCHEQAAHAAVCRLQCCLSPSDAAVPLHYLPGELAGHSTPCLNTAQDAVIQLDHAVCGCS
jgi:hypothetical protein